MVTVRGLLELVCATSRGQIVQSVMPVLNLSVWYSIKIASKFEGVFTALLIMTGELLLLFGIFFSVSLFSEWKILRFSSDCYSVSITARRFA